jgi:hypothetical protein
MPEELVTAALVGARRPLDAIFASRSVAVVGASERAGSELEQRLFAQIRRTGLRLMGPNCLGVIRPQTARNASFAAGMALPGNVAFPSHGHAPCALALVVPPNGADCIRLCRCLRPPTPAQRRAIHIVLRMPRSPIAAATYRSQAHLYCRCPHRSSRPP